MATFAQIETRLKANLKAPAVETPERLDWLEGNGANDFLLGSVTGDVPILVTTSQFFLCAVLVPLDDLTGDLREASLRWYCNPSRTWNIMAWKDRKTGESSAILHAPSPVFGSGVFDEAEAIVFVRHFARGAGDGNYVEANQQIAHSAGLHRRDDRQAYSRLNELGDFQDVIRFKPLDDGFLCTIDAEVLDQYMCATRRALVRLFQIDRCDDSDKWRTHEQDIRPVQFDDLYAEHTQLLDAGAIGGSRLFGAQILREIGNRAEHVKKLLGEDEQSRRMASFLIPSGKDGQTRIWPADKGSEGEHDPAPHLITPVFFNPEVLSRFKRDQEKYILTASTIECVGGWFLRSYDVNTEGQVYVYLKDLWSLPYSEQRYWSGFNEAPRAGISERSYAHDFLAKPWAGVDPLFELQQTLRSFPVPVIAGNSVPVWSAGQDDSCDRTLHRLHYVLIDSPDDWGSHLHELHKIIVEGFDKKTLKRVARSIGIENEAIAAEGSLKLLERILRARGIDVPSIEAICGPLYEIHALRSNAGVGHRGGSRPEEDLRVHFRDLIGRTWKAMSRLSRLIQEGRLDVETSGGAGDSDTAPLPCK